MEKRNASVAVVGAGDFIGAAICKRFAAEGYRVHGGRRGGEKLAALKAEIEATGGITLENVRAYAEAGADFASIGALTHSVRAADLAIEVRAVAPLSPRLSP